MNKGKYVPLLGLISILLLSGSIFSALPITLFASSEDEDDDDSTGSNQDTQPQEADTNTDNQTSEEQQPTSEPTSPSIAVGEPNPCAKPVDDGRPQPDKGANKDATTWKVVPMKDDPNLFKVVDSEGINVADQFDSEANAKQYISYSVCNMPSPTPTNTRPLLPGGEGGPAPTNTGPLPPGGTGVGGAGFSYKDGFKFPNRYDNPVYAEALIPDFLYKGGTGPLLFTTQGRCGGMAFAALDYYYAQLKTIPGYTTTPPNDNPLSKYILERLYDSWGIGDKSSLLKSLLSVFKSLSPIGSVGSLETGPKFIYFTAAGNENKGSIAGYCKVGCIPGVRGLTDQEVKKATSILDQGKPIVLGLIGGSSLKELGKNHQVVAYKYEFNDRDKHYTFHIYDPNHPYKDVRLAWYHPSDEGLKLYSWYEEIYSRCGPNYVPGAECDESKADPKLVGKLIKTELPSWRGFFVEDYTPKIPPDMVIDMDDDGVEDSRDNCRDVYNPDQTNTNGDEFGDACQKLSDQDNDGVDDSIDNCRWVANPDQNADACKDVIL